MHLLQAHSPLLMHVLQVHLIPLLPMPEMPRFLITVLLPELWRLQVLLLCVELEVLAPLPMPLVVMLLTQLL